MTDHPQKKAPRRGTYTAKLEKVLETLFPTSLDDIVRKNRELVQIGLATAEEFASRAARIEPGRPVDTIDHGRLIAVRALGPPCTGRGTNDNFRLSLLVDAVETRRIQINSQG